MLSVFITGKGQKPREKHVDRKWNVLFIFPYHAIVLAFGPVFPQGECNLLLLDLLNKKCELERHLRSDMKAGYDKHELRWSSLTLVLKVIIIKNTNSYMNLEECVGLCCIKKKSHWETWSHWLDCVVLLVGFCQVLNFCFLLHKKNIFWCCKIWSSKFTWIKVIFTDFIIFFFLSHGLSLRSSI